MRPRSDPQAGTAVAARAAAVAVLLALGLAAVAGRAFQLQVLRHGALAGEAADQYVRELRLKPRRGVITDRNGVLLAGSADAESAYFDPALLAASRDPERGVDPEAQLRQAARLLKQDWKGVQRKLARGNRFAWLARRVPPAEAAALRAFLAREQVKGIGLTTEPRRYYPKAELASQLLGLVDDDGAGREGIELFQDDYLQGSADDVRLVRDGQGRLILPRAMPGREREGARVELTLDAGLQAVVEQALARQVQGARALAGMAVALDPRTGEVLAMATVPVTNANAPRTPDQLRNRPVVDPFEPGSTMKTFALAAALDAGQLHATDAIDCGQGAYAIGGHVIHDHGAIGWCGPSKILAQSSNIGAARVAQRLGAERLRQGLAAFGFGEKTGSGLPAETRGQLLLAPTQIGLATQAFGQGPISASALQVTSAMAAIANGGVLVEPHLVRRVLAPGDAVEVLDETEPKVVRRAVSAATAATLTRWLTGVIEDPKGTGHKAALDGWRAAGKTGTAQKPDPVTRLYGDRRFSSFVGFAPVSAPRIVIGVFIDEPKGDVFGGEVAAPAFKEIAENALRTLGVPPDPGKVAAAALEPPREAAGEAEPDAAELEAVEWAGAEAAPAAGDKAIVPSLAGLPARSAVLRLETSNLGAELRGTGRVVDQQPPAGREVPRGTRVRMTLAPAG